MEPRPPKGRDVSDNKGAEQGYDGRVIRPIGPNWEGVSTDFEEKVCRKTTPRSRVDAQGTEWWYNPEAGGWMR
jgi:hypothetical protein